MLAWIEIFLATVACFGIGAMYTITGYEIINLLTDGPEWKPWEQAIFWLVWPVIIPAFLAAVIAVFLAALLVSIFIAVVTTFDIIKSIVIKLFKK
jgi:hypothetical protein